MKSRGSSRERSWFPATCISITWTVGGGVEEDLFYAFEASTDLAQWTKIAVRTNVTDTVEYTPATSSSPQRFYRVRVP